MLLIYIILAIISIYALYKLCFWATHKRELTNEEIKLLAEKKRIFDINQYFNFNTKEISVDTQFKSRLKPTGKLYAINENLPATPSIAAALLKYKKHEWVMLAFEKDKKVEYLYVNKGFDGSSVSLYWEHCEVAEFCTKNKVSTVLMFHNHPNSNPNIYDCTKPSSADINSAHIFSEVLDRQNINLIEFVCERGLPYRYFYSYCNSFLKVAEYIDFIEKNNGLTKKQNYSLHRELRRLKQIRYA